MKDLGVLHYCLDIAFWRESGKTFITQSKYAREILDKFQMSECKAVSGCVQEVGGPFRCNPTFWKCIHDT